MNSMVIYASRYGSSRRYAMAVSERWNLPAYAYTNVPACIGSGDRLVYIGAVFAGTILGLRDFLAAHGDTASEIVVMAVGMYDPQRERNRRHLQRQVATMIAGTNLVLRGVCCLRGSLDVHLLSCGHRILIGMMYMRARRRTSSLSDEDRDLIEAYEGRAGCGEQMDSDAMAMLVRHLGRVDGDGDCT